MKILDVGCGTNKEQGAVGIDKYQLPGVDIVHDLDKFPWPFEDDIFDKVLFRHSINHLNDLLAVMGEVHRICKPDAEVVIIAPHFSSDNIFTDPTVKFFLGVRSMDYLSGDGNVLSARYGFYSSAKFDVELKRIFFYKSELSTTGDKVMHLLFMPFDILFNRAQRFYEKYLAFIIRANEVSFVLRVRK